MWTLRKHQPAVVSSLSGPIELESKRATDAAATGVDSVCRASVTNGVVAAASWQPTVEAICEPGGTVRDGSWHPTERWWSAAAGLVHHSSQASDPTGPPARIVTISSVVVRSMVSPLKRASAVPSKHAKKRREDRHLPKIWIPDALDFPPTAENSLRVTGLAATNC